MSGLLTYSQHTSHPTAPTSGNHHLYFYSDGKLYRMDSTGTPVEVGAAGGGSNTTIVTLGSDVATTSTSFGDVTGLSFAVTSGTMYRFDIFVAYTTASNVAAKWSLNGPTLTLGCWQTEYVTSSASQVTTSNFLSSYDSGFINSGTATGANLTLIRGYVQTSASGTLVVRFASGTGGTAVTAKAGSTITYW